MTSKLRKSMKPERIHLREAGKGLGLDQLQIDQAKAEASYNLALGRKPKLA